MNFLCRIGIHDPSELKWLSISKARQDCGRCGKFRVGRFYYSFRPDGIQHFWDKWKEL